MSGILIDGKKVSSDINAASAASASGVPNMPAEAAKPAKRRIRRAKPDEIGSVAHFFTIFVR